MTSVSLYKELFEGELSEVDEDCPGCQELEYTKSSNLFHEIFNGNGKIILHEISDLSKDLDENALDAFVRLLILYRMHKTLAKLIIIRKLNVEESILPGTVKKMIKNKKRINKNIHDIFNEEVEQLYGKSFRLNQPKEKKDFWIVKINYKTWIVVSCIVASK